SSVDNPISLYAATKKSNELMAYSYSHLYDIQTIGLRFFTVYGPWGRPEEVKHEYGLTCLSALSAGVKYDAVMLAVAHHEFQVLDLETLKKDNAVVYDVKGILELSDCKL